MNKQHVILVSPNDEPVGTMEKMEVHRKGLLHRAFSVFIFDKTGRMLLQQRALGKYHGGGLWSNTCCSHPYPEESVELAAKRRLEEEMGFNTPLKKVFEFTYKATVENQLTEHEYDHVFVGEFEGAVNINKEEVVDYRYEDMEKIKQDLVLSPQKFTSWFQLAFPKIEAWWQQEYQKVPFK